MQGKSTKVSYMEGSYMATKKVVLEVAQGNYNVDEVADRAMKALKKETKATIKDFNVYIKPEDGKAYYTANGGKISGAIDL